MKNKTSRYQELDALRGLAALMVVFFHFTLGREEAKLGFKLGTTGVDLFFIISGFVIFMSLNNVKTSKEFVINRISRLYPTYWATVTFTFLLICSYSIFKHQDIPFTSYLANMTMFQYYLGVANLDDPYWTMIIEMVFYIGMLILFHLKKFKYLNAIGLTLSILVAFFANVFNADFVFHTFKPIPLLPFVPLFFAGTIFYKIFINKTELLFNYCMLFICLSCQALMYKQSGRSWIYISQIEYTITLTIYFLLFLLFVNGHLKFLVSKVSLFFGKISFSLYLIHQYISKGFILPILINKYHVNFWIASLLVALPVVILLASLITFYIEIPLGARLKKKLRIQFNVT